MRGISPTARTLCERRGGGLRARLLLRTLSEVSVEPQREVSARVLSGKSLGNPSLPVRDL